MIKIFKKLKMRIYLKFFKDKNIGNGKNDYLLLSTNKILVSDLKLIIFQKYGIEKSSQRLSIKICQSHFTIMNDEFPLFFFRIKEKSIIYIDIIEKSKKDKEIIKRIKQRENKSRYLRRLNIFQKRPNMDIIKESSIEDVDDTETKSYSLETSNHINNIDFDDLNSFEKIIEKRFVDAIMKNKLNEFRDIMSHYSDIININKSIGNKGIYSPIHYASIYGYSEMMEDLMNKYNADVNLISSNGWAPLHLSAYKGNIKIVNLLLKFKKTNFDLILPKIGTALHCACLNNNFKIVALLLHKCNPNIKNDQGLLPIDITDDLNIKNIINKTLNIFSDFEDNNNDVSISIIKSDESMGDFITKDQLEKFKFLSTLTSIPPRPDKYTGYLYKKGKIFPHYNLRYIEINAIKGYITRFINKDDYPRKPKEVLSLKDIISCKKKKTSEEGKYYMELEFCKMTHLYRFDSLKICEMWLDEINKSVTYYKFWNKLEAKHPDVITYLSSLKQDSYEIDYLSGEVRKLELNQNSNGNNNKSSNNQINNNSSRRNSIVGKEESLKNIENNLFNKSNMDINYFEILELLYVGSFGKVYKVKMKLNDNIFCMKVLNKKYLAKNNLLKNIINENNKLKQLISPFIITLHYMFQTPEYIYLILDYCPGGDLNFFLMHTTFDEKEAKFYIAELILAIEYLHKIDVDYINLSSENIMISLDNHIKLADFALTKQTNNEAQNQNYNSKIRGYSKSADIYDIGAILYEMICGTPPFYLTYYKSNIKNKENELIFEDYFSDDLKDLISKLLYKDPNKRIGLSNKVELKNHPWFHDINWDKLSRKGIKPPLNLVLMKKEFDDNIGSNTKDEEGKEIDGKSLLEKLHKKYKNFSFVRPNKGEII